MSHLQAAIGEDVDSEVDKPLALNRNIGYEDMTQMEEMDLESLLGNCRLRYAHDQIYTYTGTILVAINPFKRVPIYGPNWLKLYPHQRIGSQPPHVYAIAEAAFSAMGEKNKNQSMLISGESGAGKTETTKLILRYLTRRAHLEISGGMTADKTSKDKGVEKKILESVPILEALGNAKTLRNDNSSRFGKYIEVQFNKDNRIVGSKITPYLLEKSRIVHQLPGERNFHIFYQLTEGASDETRARYHFGRAMDYEYLNKSGCIALSWSSYDEASALKGFEEALTIFAISEKARDGMYRILSAILHLGNVLWVDAEVSGVVNIANDKAQQALNLAAELLGFAPEQLKYQLSHQRVVIAGETIWKNLDAQQCRYLTDSFAKAIYSKLFDWLVLKLNASMHADAGGHRTKNTIGVLDIFGFENFVNNSFEQFLINYCNEQLQKFFNHYIFALEQAEYEREKIDWSLIDFVDNQATLDLIDRNKPTGILALLDDQCRQPKSTDQTYIDACHKLFGEGQTQLYNKIRLKRTHFAVTHYAGQVEYNVAGWLDKNKDELPVHLTEAVVNDSTNTFAALLFSDPEKEERPSVSTSASSLSASSSSSSASSSSSPAGAANSRVTRTTGAYFKQQLKSLMDNLALTEPHFVRTIKPNLQAKPNTFDDAEIQAQLLYAGMLETIRIRRLGYPVRFPFADFLYKFHVLRPSFPRDADPRKSCQNLVTALGISLQNIQVGLNKVFLKQDTANGLEEMRGIALSGAVIRIQTWWRMASLRRLFLVKKFAATQIQAAFRGHAQKKRFQRIKKSALIAQRAIRRYQARQILIRLKNDRAAYLKHLSAMEKAELERKAAEAQAVETQKFELLLAQQATKKKKNKNQEAAGSEDAAAAAAAAVGEGADAASTAAEGTSEAAEGDTSVASSSVPPQEAPPVILENKIYLTVAYPSGRSIHASATVLMFRFHKLRDHTSELNDISRDTALEHVGQGQVVVPANVPGLTQDASFHGETFTVNFPHISNKTTTLACLLNIFSRDTTFEGNSILVTLTDAKTKNNLASAYFPITYATAEQSGMLCCQFLREGASRWVFKPEGRLLPGRNYKLSMPSLIDMLPVPPRPRAFDVTIHGARGLGAVRDTPPDTYAVVSLDVSRFNTPVSKKEINPNWNFYGRLVGQAHVIDLRVYAKVAWAGDTLVGSAVIPFSDTELLQMKEQWIKLDRRGQVHFSIIETRADAPLPERAHEQEAAKRPATLTRRLSQSRLTRMSISLPKPSPSSSSASIPQLMDLASFSITTGVAATPRSAPESMARELKSVAHNTVIQRFTFEGLPHHVKTIPLNVEMTAADILVEVAQRIEVAPDSLELCDRVVGRLEPIIIDSTPVAHDQAELQTPRGTQIKNARQLLKVTAAGRIVLSNRDLVVCPRGWAAAKYPPVVRPTSSSSSSSKSRKSRKSSSSSSSSSSKSSSKKRSFFGRK